VEAAEADAEITPLALKPIPDWNSPIVVSILDQGFTAEEGGCLLEQVYVVTTGADTQLKAVEVDVPAVLRVEPYPATFREEGGRIGSSEVPAEEMEQVAEIAMARFRSSLRPQSLHDRISGEATSGRRSQELQEASKPALPPRGVDGLPLAKKEERAEKQKAEGGERADGRGEGDQAACLLFHGAHSVLGEGLALRSRVCQFYAAPTACQQFTNASLRMVLVGRWSTGRVASPSAKSNLHGEG
jgi:hypothetical protein